MLTAMQSTTRRQLDERLASLDLKTNLEAPREGWLRTVRRALGMRLIDVATRIGTSETAVRQSERLERSGGLTLRQARRIADAMGCELVYALVPKASLDRQFEHRVHQRAARDAGRIARSMSLERQDIDAHAVEQQRADLVSQYLRAPPKDLWGE